MNKMSKIITSTVLAGLIAMSGIASVGAVSYKGDIDGDGRVTSSDALALLKNVVGLDKTELDMTVADLDGDEKLTSSDALQILKTCVGQIAPVEVEAENSEFVFNTKQEVADYYNSTINKIVSSQLGFKKTRTTELEQLTGAESFMKIKAVADAVNDFLGVGTKTYTNTKGTSKYLSTASLTASDIVEAKIEPSKDIYTITLTLADGSSTAPTYSSTSPLRRCGAVTTATDATEDDYKDAKCIYSAITSADGASVKSVKDKTTNIKAVLVVDITTGNIRSLTISYDWQVTITDMKYSWITLSGDKVGTAKTTISINSIEY